jgi:hypothetical protein
LLHRYLRRDKAAKGGVEDQCASRYADALVASPQSARRLL